MHIQDNGDSYQLHLPAAGLRFDDLLISVEDRDVKIRRRNEDQASGSDTLQQIRVDSLRKISRTIRLPRDSDPSTLVTSMSHGMLELNVAKSPSTVNAREDEGGNVANSSKARNIAGISKSAMGVAVMLAVIAGLIGTAMVAGPAVVTKASLVALKGLALAPLVLLEVVLVISCALLRFFFFFSLFSMLFAPFSMPCVLAPRCAFPPRTLWTRASPRHCYQRNWHTGPESIYWL